MTLDNASKPVAQGSFSKTPFAHILIYLLNRKMGGTLEVVASNSSGKQITVTIYFREGIPSKVRSSIPGKGLGDLLRDQGVVTSEQLDAALNEMATSGLLIGEILVSQGVIDAAGLVKGLREQMLSKLVDVFCLTNGSYAFFDKVNSLVGFGPDELFPLDPFQLLMAGIRTHGDRLAVKSMLGSLQGKWLSILPVEEKDGDTLQLQRFRLTSEEQKICMDLLQNPMKYEDLMAKSTHELSMVRNILYVFMITKRLQMSDEPPPPTILPGDPVRLTSDMPEPHVVEDPKIAAMRKKIEEKAAAIAAQNCFEMLELSPDAPPEAARKAFFKMAKEYHPDKASAGLGNDLRETLKYIFSNLSEAHSTLTDLDARDEYVATVKSGDKKDEGPSADELEVQRVLEAENLFQKAQVFLRRDQFEKAREFIDKAVDLNPEEAEFRATKAFISGIQAPADQRVDENIEVVRKACEQNPKSERMALYMAQLLKKGQRHSETKTYFKKVLQINPNNIEAARELRLLAMREKRETDNPKSFFSKFWK